MAVPSPRSLCALVGVAGLLLAFSGVSGGCPSRPPKREAARPVAPVEPASAPATVAVPSEEAELIEAEEELESPEAEADWSVERKHPARRPPPRQVVRLTFGGDETAPSAPAPPDDAWQRHVVPLLRRADGDWTPWCSGAFVGGQLLLTAAHCLRGDGALVVGDRDGSAGPATPLPGGDRFRACLDGPDGSCLSPSATVSADEDVGTAYIDDERAAEGIPPLHFEGRSLPQMMLLAYGGAEAPAQLRTVCDATFRDLAGEVAASDASVRRGDSGGPLVAFLADGTAVVLGVVSGYDPGSDDWLFTPVPSELPLPTGAPDEPEVRTENDAGAFARLPACL